MRSIISSIFCLFLLMGTASFAYSQNKNEESNYNLPPGYKLNPKKQIYDLSDKLYGFSELDISKSELEVLQQISDEELKDTSPEYQNYIQTGRAFLNSLSNKVKSIYTEEELWYIYVFDQSLKEKLTQI